MKRFLERLQTFRGLHWQERLLLVQAWLLLIAMDLALRLLPFKALLAGIQASRAACEIDDTRLSPPLPRLIWLVESAGRFVPISVTCLKQALVLSLLLRRRGVSTTVQIGVKTEDGMFIAHAWLERQGRVIFGLSGKEQYNQLSPSMSPLIGN